jgi:hypothetical protein
MYTQPQTKRKHISLARPFTPETHRAQGWASNSLLQLHLHSCVCFRRLRDALPPAANWLRLILPAPTAANPQSAIRDPQCRASRANWVRLARPGLRVAVPLRAGKQARSPEGGACNPAFADRLPPRPTAEPDWVRLFSCPVDASNPRSQSVPGNPVVEAHAGRLRIHVDSSSETAGTTARSRVDPRELSIPVSLILTCNIVACLLYAPSYWPSRKKNALCEP